MNGSKQRARRIGGVLLLSLAAATANEILVLLITKTGSSLFMDTAFTITAVFSGGLAAGLLTAAFTTVAIGIGFFFYYGHLYAWSAYFYGLCSAAVALIAWLFTRSFPDECLPLRLVNRREAAAVSLKSRSSLLDIVVMLSLLSLTTWLVISVMGGFIAVFIYHFFQTAPGEEARDNMFKLGLFQRGFSRVFVEIFARIPINIIDRPLSALIGFGTSLLLAKVFRNQKGA